MENENNILPELKNIAPAVANLNNRNLYSVPQGYFDTLPGLITDKLKIGGLPFVNATPFTAPENFFNRFPDFILQKIRLESAVSHHSEVYDELEKVAPLLNSISKRNVFSIDKAYFSEADLETISKRKTFRIASIGPSIRKWVTYAAAASILTIVASSSFLYVNLHKHKIMKPISIDERIAGLNDAEIMDYLKDNHEVIQGDLISSGQENEDPEINNLLKKASDEEIQNYLDSYSNGASEKGI